MYKRRKIFSLECSFSHSPQQPAIGSHVLFLEEKLLNEDYSHLSLFPRKKYHLDSFLLHLIEFTPRIM